MEHLLDPDQFLEEYISGGVNYLAVLPVELLYAVCKILPPASIASLARCSKQLHEALQAPAFWGLLSCTSFCCPGDAKPTGCDWRTFFHHCFELERYWARTTLYAMTFSYPRLVLGSLSPDLSGFVANISDNGVSEERFVSLDRAKTYTIAEDTDGGQTRLCGCLWKKRLVFLLRPLTILIWDQGNQRVSGRIRGDPTADFTAVDYDEVEGWCAVGDKSGKLHIGQLQARQSDRSIEEWPALTAHSSPVTHIRFLGSGSLLSIGMDGICFWLRGTAGSGRFKCAFKSAAFSSALIDLIVATPGLALAATTQHVQVWSIGTDTLTLSRTLAAQSCSVDPISTVAADELHLAVARGPTIDAFHLEDGACPHVPQLSASAPVRGLSLDWPFLAFGEVQGDVCIANLRLGSILHRYAAGGTILEVRLRGQALGVRGAQHMSIFKRSHVLPNKRTKLDKSGREVRKQGWPDWM